MPRASPLSTSTSENVNTVVTDVFPSQRRQPSPAVPGRTRPGEEPVAHLTSWSILNIGRYIEITIIPTMAPTPIIMIGSMIEVSDWMLVSTSSS